MYIHVLQLYTYAPDNISAKRLVERHMVGQKRYLDAALGMGSLTLSAYVIGKTVLYPGDPRHPLSRRHCISGGSFCFLG